MAALGKIIQKLLSDLMSGHNSYLFLSSLEKEIIANGEEAWAVRMPRHSGIHFLHAGGFFVFDAKQIEHQRGIIRRVDRAWIRIRGSVELE